jgi:glycine/D-amino acid oxidase-like deaminating enzyme
MRPILEIGTVPAVKPAPRRARRSWWLEEALALPGFAGPSCPPLDHDTSADVVVLGGGYTGMWAAYSLHEREPGLDVVLLEQDICGGGPSGRNAGFVNGLWFELEELERRYGATLALRIARMADDSVDAIGAWCERHDVDAWFARNGDVGVATSQAQEPRAREMVSTAERLGVPDVHRPLSPEEVRTHARSPLFRAGVWSPGGAGVQPARLARGLRRVLLERGVRIFEHSPVRRFTAGPPVVAETPTGSVRASRAIVGLNAWARSWSAFRRSLMVRGTYMVITAPAPERLEEIGWTGGEGLYDLRTALHYLRATPDGRIAFGGAGLRVTSTRRVDARFAYDERSVRELVEDLHAWFPPFRDVPIECGWGGPVDVSAGHLPFFGTLRGGSTHHALGFTGNGVAPCHLAGRILSGLALDVVDDATSLPIVGERPKPFPRAPIFVPGERLVTHAVLRKDAREDRDRRAGALTGWLARLPRRLGYNLGP